MFLLYSETSSYSQNSNNFDLLRKLSDRLRSHFRYTVCALKTLFCLKFMRIVGTETLNYLICNAVLLKVLKNISDR
jgi:hypothetical protein